jgi:hypothetical protein
MASRQGFQELVVLFDATGSKIGFEMRLGQFNSLLAQKGTLASHAARVVKAAYTQVGAGLSVRGVVFFQFNVNEQGYVDPAFNLPLEYMAEHAGTGPDLGHGPINMACRSQCPVPWHGINMWEPAGEGKAHPAMLVQKSVWRNRLGLKPIPMIRQGNGVSTLQGRARVEAHREVAGIVEMGEAVNGSVTLPKMQAKIQAMGEKLTATFGKAARVSTSQHTRHDREQVGQVAAQLRAEMERQQQGYLEQIKNCREEIQKLKSALRHEQERNRRLQQLLRGDV